MDNLIEEYCKVGVIKFGEFKLKSGVSSNIYFDFRILVSYPELLAETADAIWKKLLEVDLDKKINTLCGVPYTALPIATCVSVKHNVPMILRRKEQKEYGTGNLLEGIYTQGTNCLVIEDVVTSGASILETVKVLRDHSITVTDVIAILDREQGGRTNLHSNEIHFHNIFTSKDFIRVGNLLGKIPSDIITKLESSFNMILINKVAEPIIPKLGLSQRKNLITNVIAKRLIDLMIKKKTNLCVAIDLTVASEVLKMANEVGPYCCVIKLHVDIIEDFSQGFLKSLEELAAKHELIIFEDRKFSDIGNTVSLQFHKGMYQISKFADIVNAHVISGESIVQGLKENPDNQPYNCLGLLLIAEMSCVGNIMDARFVTTCLDIAKNNSDFVIGFICQNRLDKSGKFLHFTPGVSLISKSDSLGQKYISPSEAKKNGTDIIIVGRSITNSSNPAAEAEKYQKLFLDY